MLWILEKHLFNIMENLVSIKNLSVGFQSQNIKSNVVKSISFEIPKGKTVALVGESGSGKTVTALSILKLLPYPSAFHDSGEIIYNNIDLLKSKQNEIQKIRGKNISAIFQEPMTSLNPLHTIEKQVNEILMIHSSISYSEASKKTKAETDHINNKGPSSGGGALQSTPPPAGWTFIYLDTPYTVTTFMATHFLKARFPRSWARWTLAIPPSAMCPSSR